MVAFLFFMALSLNLITPYGLYTYCLLALLYHLCFVFLRDIELIKKGVAVFIKMKDL